MDSFTNSCLEAQGAVRALKLDYFIYLELHSPTDSDVVGTVRKYVNFDIDTIWLTSLIENISPGIQFICGRSRIRPQVGGYYLGCMYERRKEKFQLHSERLGKPDNLPRLAINFPSWVKPRQHDMGSSRLVMASSIKELRLIVGDFRLSDGNESLLCCSFSRSLLYQTCYVRRGEEKKTLTSQNGPSWTKVSRRLC